MNLHRSNGERAEHAQVLVLGYQTERDVFREGKEGRRMPSLVLMPAQH